MASTTADAPKSDAKSPPKKTITREEHRALLNLHINKLRLAKAKVEEVRAPFDAAKEELTAQYHEARADLGKGYTRKRLAALLEDITNRLRNLLQEEQDRHQDRIDLSLPVFGVQVDLFSGEGDKRPQEAKDEAFWFAEGALAGRRASERKPPEGCPPRMDQHYLAGYDAGQAEVGRLFIAAQEIKKRLAEPAADQKPVELNTREPTVDEEKAAERKAVRRAKESLAAMGAPANEVMA
ncbi:MAG: hypothetical protein JWQ97_965 [Phenylobacterium sp.]|nr:hypothetical protein [Phenylobacterium sp.]